MEFVSALLEIVNDGLFADGLEDFLHEVDVGGVVLVIVLRFHYLGLMTSRGGVPWKIS